MEKTENKDYAVVFFPGTGIMVFAVGSPASDSEKDQLGILEHINPPVPAANGGALELAFEKGRMIIRDVPHYVVRFRKIK